MDVNIKTGCKINLTLDIIGRRDDGYHLLNTVMQNVALYDYICLREMKSGIAINCDLKYIPCNESNIAYKAARMFFDLSGINGGVYIGMKKLVPVCAGMGGGSGNAAGVLYGLNELFGRPLSLAVLKENSVKLGADVPFFFDGGLCLCSGVGEHTEKLRSMPECSIVILKDARGISTPKAYADFDAHPKDTEYTAKFIPALNAKSFEDIGKSIGNVLYDTSKDICPEIRRNIETLRSYGAYAAMTGSGSAVYGLFDDREKAVYCHKNEKDRHDRVILTSAADSGYALI